MPDRHPVTPQHAHPPVDELEAEFARRFDAGHIRWDQHDMPVQATLS